MAFLRSPYIKFSAIDTNGLPLIGGKVYTYIAGTNTPTDTWSDFGVTLNSNPIILNSMGQANIFLTENLAYKYVVKDAFDNTIETQDNIISSLGGDDISSAILKNGTSTTTAQIPFAEGLSSAKGLRITEGLYGPGSPQIFLGDDTNCYILRNGVGLNIQNSALYNPFSIYNYNVSTDSSVAGFGFNNTGIEVMQGGEVVPSYIKYKLYNPNAGGFNGHIFEGAGISITAPFVDGSALKIPNNSWIRPQTEHGGMYLTNGEDPTDLNSILKLTTGETVLTNGDGSVKHGQISLGAGGVSIVHNEDGSSNSSISLSDTNATIYSGDNSNLVLSASSATMYGGDSNLTLNSTYASLYQAGSGFYIDSTGIKAQGVAAGTITTDGNLGLDSNGYIVKSTNPTESNRTVSSGLYNDGDGVLSIGTGGAGVATTFSISDGSGFIENNGVVTTVTWTGKTNIAITNIATQNITYISIDINGNVIQQAIRWTPVEFSNNIVLGVVVHVNRVNVDAVNNEQSVMTNASQQVGDVLEGIGFVNIDGNIFGPNGATLGLTKTAGLVMNRGINWVNGGHENPHKLTLPVLSPVTALQYRMRDGTSSALNLTVVNPNIYDDGSAYGSAPAVPTNKFTVQRIYAFTSNNVKIQPGQAVYNSLAEAKANIQLEPFITEPSIASNGILRGFLCIQQGTTSLTDASKVFLISAGKFGGSTGVGGLSVSTLQNAYDNSTNPEILTNTSLGSVSIKRGSASDTDAVLEILNGAGTTTARINGDGSAVLLGALSGTSATFSGLVTAKQLAQTQQTSAITTGAITWDLNSGNNLYLSGAITGAVTITTSNILAGTKGTLTGTMGATSQIINIAQTGVTFVIDKTTVTANNTIALSQIYFAPNSFFEIQFNWVGAGLCYIVIVNSNVFYNTISTLPGSATRAPLNIADFVENYAGTSDGSIWKSAVDTLQIRMGTNTRTFSFLEKAETFNAVKTFSSTPVISSTTESTTAGAIYKRTNYGLVGYEAGMAQEFLSCIYTAPVGTALTNSTTETDVNGGAALFGSRTLSSTVMQIGTFICVKLRVKFTNTAANTLTFRLNWSAIGGTVLAGAIITRVNAGAEIFELLFRGVASVAPSAVSDTSWIAQIYGNSAFDNTNTSIVTGAPSLATSTPTLLIVSAQWTSALATSSVQILNSEITLD